MASTSPLDTLPDVEARVSPEEWQTRIDLATAYRLVALFGWDDLVFTHITAKVPGTEHFLIDPYGFMFEEITASSLVEIDGTGCKVLESPFDINPAGFTIHSCTHAARHDAACVLHTHSVDGVAVSAEKAGLRPISQFAASVLHSLGISPLLAAVAANAPFKIARELIDYARADPGKISFGSSGNGSASHLTTELLELQTQTRMVHIPYRGAAPALADLLGGQIQLLFDAPTGLIPAGKDGKIRLIGVAGEQRLPAVPDVPTFIEQGFAGFAGSTRAGMLASTGTPEAIVQRMAEEVTAIVRSAEMRLRFDTMVTFLAGGTPAAFDAFIATETAKWAKVIRAADVKIDG